MHKMSTIVLTYFQDQKDENRQRCAGMYSRRAWGGSVDPFILTKFVKNTEAADDADPIVSLVIFEWRDEELIGVYPTVDAQVNSSLALRNYLETDRISLSERIYLRPRKRRQ